MMGQALTKKKLPDTPGVYQFKKGRKILYIGKATSLRDRVRSYFRADVVRTRSPLIVKMLEEATDVAVIETDSVLEALILEAALIKRHQPPYNTKEKSNTSFNYVVITDEAFPVVKVVRGRNLHSTFYPLHSNFGPFPHGAQLHDALKIIRKIFPFRDEKCKAGIGKPCFNRQIGLCPGTCTGEISPREYAKTIRHLKLFFEGKKKELVRVLEKEMKQYARQEKFEKAATIKKQIFALKHIQDVALLKTPHSTFHSPHSSRIEAYDVAHISETNRVGVMTVVEDTEAKKSDYRKFKIKEAKLGDTAALKEILERRLAHPEWTMPRLIVVDGGKAQKNAAERVLREAGVAIPVVAVVKDERHKPKGILGKKEQITEYEKAILLANTEAHRFALSYHRKLQRTGLR